MKKLITIGDSITKGTFTNVGEKAPLSIASPNFSDILKDKLFANSLTNYGCNSISYSSTSPVASELAVTKRIFTTEEADIVVLAAGTNDFGTNVIMGSTDDKKDISFYGALYVVFREIKRKYSNSEIYVITPLHRKDEASNEKGYRLADYSNAIKVRCEEFGFPYIDSFDFCIDLTKEEDRQTYGLDGVHLNCKGHILFGEFIYENIKKIRHLTGKDKR